MTKVHRMSQPQRTAIVTGSAGFIGFHLSSTLLNAGWRVIGVDAMTDYYDVALKEKRQAMLCQSRSFRAVNDRIEQPGLLETLFSDHRPDAVIHLAAQAGVRYSIEAPESYVEANLIGTFRLLEAARAYPPAHLLLASTSSVYGANPDMPYAETDKADTQMSFYAATKKANEAMAHSYAHLFYGKRAKLEEQHEDEPKWMIFEKVDKPVYFISRAQDLESTLGYFPHLKETDRKGGYVILERTDQNYPFLGER